MEILKFGIRGLFVLKRERVVLLIEGAYKERGSITLTISFKVLVKLVCFFFRKSTWPLSLLELSPMEPTNISSPIQPPEPKWQLWERWARSEVPPSLSHTHKPKDFSLKPWSNMEKVSEMTQIWARLSLMLQNPTNKWLTSNISWRMSWNTTSWTPLLIYWTTNWRMLT